MKCWFLPNLLVPRCGVPPITAPDGSNHEPRRRIGKRISGKRILDSAGHHRSPQWPQESTRHTSSAKQFFADLWELGTKLALRSTGFAVQNPK